MSEEIIECIGGTIFLFFWLGMMGIFLDDITEDLMMDGIILWIIGVDVIFALLFFFNIFIVIGFFGLLAGLLVLQRNWWEIKNAIKERRNSKKAVTSKREQNLSKK